MSSADASRSKPKSKLSCLSSLLRILHVGRPPRSEVNGAAVNDGEGQGAKQKSRRQYHGSVYMSALQHGNLSAEELAAVKAFEEAADEARRDVSNHGAGLTDSKHLSGQTVYHDAGENVGGDWSYLDEMMYAPAKTANRHKRASITMDEPSTLLARQPPGGGSMVAKMLAPAVRRRLSSVVVQLKEPAVRVQIRGYPGELTDEELESCQRLRAELDRRSATTSGDDGADDGKVCREIVDAFHTVEEEPYALCRFLRARNFDVDAVLEMLENGVKIWREGERHDFFPDANIAIGAPLPVFRTQYPMLYAGIAKNGCPVSYFKAGRISVEGLECVTTLGRLSNLAWHQTMHNFPSQIAKAQAMDPDAVRCEAIAVVDLKGLSPTALNARTLEVMKSMAQINQCFPEILNCMVVLNAPSFFSFSWMVIKRFIDARTASKVTIFSDRKKGEVWLLDRIDKKELISDYGGDGEAFDTLMQTQGGGVAARRRIVELLCIPQLAQKEIGFELTQSETVHIQVYTRSVSGADVSLFKDDVLMKEVCLRSTSSPRSDEDEPEPYCTEITSCVEGPGKFRVVAKSKSETHTDHFLVIGRVF